MRRTASILVIDDEDIMREILDALLAREGYHVRLAASGAEGIELAKSVPFDAVVVDVMMPGMDGMTTVDELKKIDDDLPVVMSTAFASVETAISAMKRGAFDYMSQPFWNVVVLVVGRNAVADWTSTTTNSGLYDSGGNTLQLLNFGNWSGGNNVDTFTLTNNVVNVAGNAGADVFNVNASLSANLSGGADNDTFNIAAAAVLTGTLSGGADNDTFNFAYTTMLQALHRVFNGEPDALGPALLRMQSLKAQAQVMMATDIVPGLTAGPSFEYTPRLPEA